MGNLKIKEKRDSLEKFLREQLIGPGGCMGRYHYNTAEGEGVDVINTTPGSIYSTAILFPKRRSHIEDQNRDEGERETNNGNRVDDVDTYSDDSSWTVSDVEDQTSNNDDMFALNQRYPNTIGVSCCLDATVLDHLDELKVKVSGRYYRRIRDIEQVYVHIDASGFDEFYQENAEELNKYYTYSNGDLRIRNIQGSKVGDLRGCIRSLDARYSMQIASVNGNRADSYYKSITNEDYRYLQSYKEKLFNRYKSIEDANRNHYPALTNEERDYIKGRISEIERYQTYFIYLNDLVGLVNSSDYGFWYAEPFEKEIPLNFVQNPFGTNLVKKIYAPRGNNRCEDLANIISYDASIRRETKKASISAWVQFTKGSDDSIYMKVQIENTSVFEETDKMFYSIVTEGVNRLAFWGIKIEISSRYIRPYSKGRSFNNVKNDGDRLNYLYKNIKDYGVGHECSVDWDATGDIKKVWTEFMPSVDSPDVDTQPRNKLDNGYVNGEVIEPPLLLGDNPCLQFKWLSTFSEASNDAIRKQLLEFLEVYHQWIQRDSGGAEDAFGRQVNAECLRDYNRMRSNVECILNQEEAMLAFRLMNAAMFMQLWHSKRENRTIASLQKINEEFYRTVSDEIFQTGQHAAWRPFQLAFILLNIDGIIPNPNDENWSKRNDLVDLVWFPTGGGKTEAYLGIIAMTIINRRRRFGKRGYGVTAIMRYTLRLLSTQQFQRALKLIMALEHIRSWETYNLGDKAITIGLYVGNDALPNTRADYRNECKRWSQNDESKIPLNHTCPWCGGNMTVNEGGVFQCLNDLCQFYTSFPVVLNDEDLYRNPPSLLFGTVDKFAQLASKVDNDSSKDSRRLFGRCEETYLTPDLIIQDELHLLNGPLGSAVSLFECAIDDLCTKTRSIGGNMYKYVRPKVISSTATTRNTELQIRALYDRAVNIFPKSGVDYDDSFFAFYKRKKRDGQESMIAKRRYIGIMPMGRTQMTMQMRLVAILFVHRALFEQANIEHLSDNDYKAAADYYYSIITYFNSLRDVGRTDAQFKTEFVKYTRRLFKRVVLQNHMLECFYSYDNAFSKTELTGRLSGAEVVSALNNVETSWSAEKRVPHIENNEMRYGSTPPDMVIATNMISVGIDVSRFNTIIMNSMPRNIAEYIQASSRVAREDLGLVLTLHDPFKSRDVSHYEQFKEFHEKMYYYVEPISITPFSPKALRRYLALFLATYVRHNYNNLALNDNVCNLTEDDINRIKEGVRNYFTNRLNRTMQLEGMEKELLTQQMFDILMQQVDLLLNKWSEFLEKLEDEDPEAFYKKQNQASLFKATDACDDYMNVDDAWIVPESLRFIAPGAVIHIEK